MHAIRFPAAVALAAAAALPAGPLAARNEAPLDLVLARAAAYVAGFERQLSGIVAEEAYEQREIPGEGRTLKSDLLLVRPAGLGRWLQFRDVYEVDGRPVRDRQERLSALFERPEANALDQARRIVGEGSRYNLGDIERTINTPIYPLRVLERENQWRFAFSARDRADGPEGTAGLPDSPHFRVATEVLVVRFRERESPTLVRDPHHHRDVFSHGRFWIEPASGRVLMSEIAWEHPELTARMTVSYQSDPLVGCLVPVEMRETYAPKPESRGHGPRIEATATYGRFRQIR